MEVNTPFIRFEMCLAFKISIEKQCNKICMSQKKCPESNQEEIFAVWIIQHCDILYVDQVYRAESDSALAHGSESDSALTHGSESNSTLQQIFVTCHSIPFNVGSVKVNYLHTVPISDF